MCMYIDSVYISVRESVYIIESSFVALNFRKGVT